MLLTATAAAALCRYESAEMYWRLLDCGVPAKHLVYNKVGRPGADCASLRHCAVWLDRGSFQTGGAQYMLVCGLLRGLEHTRGKEDEGGLQGVELTYQCICGFWGSVMATAVCMHRRPARQYRSVTATLMTPHTH